MGVSDLQGAKIHTIPTTRITYFVTEYQQNAQFYVIVRDRSSWIEAFAPRVIFLRRDLSPQAVWHNYGSPCSLPLSSGEPCDHLLRPEAAILIAQFGRASCREKVGSTGRSRWSPCHKKKNKNKQITLN